MEPIVCFTNTNCKSYERRLVSLHKIENNSAYSTIGTDLPYFYDEFG
jgi:hypothetical protein